MSTIAYPMYDIVFKGLMSCSELAKEILATLTRLDIQEITALPQEAVYDAPSNEDIPLRVIRVDYVALVKLRDGTLRKVMIEVQKVRQGYEVERFRKYLGTHYAIPEEITDANGEREKVFPRIFVIYFLGFNLSEEPGGCSRKNVTYIEEIEEPVTKNFSDTLFNVLDHDILLIETRKLKKIMTTDLGLLLSFFSWGNFIDEKKHFMDYPDQAILANAKPYIRNILRYLEKLASDDEVQKKMEEEDMILSEFQFAVQEQKKELRKERDAERKARELIESERDAERKARELAEIAQRKIESERDAERKARENANNHALSVLMSMGLTLEEARLKLNLPAPTPSQDH